MVLIFDLDDTLYEERTFVLSGFRAVSAVLSRIVDVNDDLVFNRLIDTLDQQGRGKIFDTVLSSFGITDDLTVQRCVTVYKNHIPIISLFPGVSEMLTDMKCRDLYLVTDGDPLVQDRKIKALEITQFFQGIYTTWSYGRNAGKPSLDCFHKIAAQENCALSDLTYVGDDPNKDFVSLRAHGATTIRVHTGRFKAAKAMEGFDAEFHLPHVTSLPLFLDGTVTY